MGKDSKEKNNTHKSVQKREKGWNNRFVVGKIQEYDAYSDKYCKSTFG